MSQYDPKFDLKINVGHSDLHFMVQLFGLIPRRVFDVQASYLWIMSQFDPKVNVGHSDINFTVQWFCHILESTLCINIILMDYESVWCKALGITVTYISQSSDFAFYL